VDTTTHRYADHNPYTDGNANTYRHTIADAIADSHAFTDVDAMGDGDPWHCDQHQRFCIRWH
jgi:hypothetical protein